MKKQINSSNSGGNEGNGERLFGTWIRPNLPPSPHRVVQNPNTIRLFGTIVSLDNSIKRESSQQYMRLFGENIPIHTSTKANPRSIQLFGQTICIDNPSIAASSQPLPSSYPNAVHYPISVIGTNIIGHHTENSFVIPSLESEYNTVLADQINPAPALPQEVIVIDSSSDEEEEQVEAHGHNDDVVMEDVQGLTNDNVEEFLELDDEDMLVDAELLALGEMEINFNDMNAGELIALEVLTRMLNGGLYPLEIEQALRIESYREMVGDRKECTVCLESFHDGEVVANLQCNHSFHPMCITNWLEQKNMCPNCRVAALDVDDLS